MFVGGIFPHKRIINKIYQFNPIYKQRQKLT